MIDTVAGVRQFEISTPQATAPLGRSDNYPRSVAGRVGADPKRAVLEVVGGQSSQHLITEFAKAIARGEAYVRSDVEDVVFCFLRFPSGLSAHLHLSWLDPHKERRFTVVGSKRMATFDDMEIERKVTVYDKGFDQDFSSYGEYIARSGENWSPRISNERGHISRRSLPRSGISAPSVAARFTN